METPHVSKIKKPITTFIQETVQWINFNSDDDVYTASIVQHRLHSNYMTEPPHDKMNKMTCAPSEDSDPPVHPPSLFRVFAVRTIGS